MIELSFSYFWLIKLTAMGITFLALYLAWRRSVTKKVVWNTWTTISLILITVQWMIPIRMEPTTAPTMRQMDKVIEERHTILPPKQVDNTFTDNAKLSGNLLKGN